MLRTTFITFLKPAAVLINLGFTSAQNGGQTVQGSDLSKCPYATESYVSPSGTNYEICPGTDYRGDNSVVINGIGSRQDCAAQCGNNQDCTKAVYDGTNQICVVKTTANDATQVWYENQRFDVIQVINTYNPATQGSWSDLIQFPLVPVACYTVPEYPESTRIMCWSAWGYDAFGQDTPEGGGGGYTQFMDFNYKTGAVSNQTISNTHHDMFCPGISALEDGRIMITGGADASVTSFYDPTTNAFTRGPDMQIARGYQTSVTLSDGKVFTIGGGYTGPRGNKNGEIFDPKANTWTLLPDAAVAPMLTTDAEGVWREDNHGWLFPRSDGWVFQAGPSPTQHWYSTNGTGSVVQAGQRPDADDQMCGMSVMYDVDVILSAGGSTDYTNSPATAMAHITTLGNPGDPVQVERIGDMAHPRGFANIVVLPDGSSLIVGGQTRSVAFTDMGGVLAPELFNPQSRTFTSMAPMAIPRNYHSTAVLLADGRVFSGGGGLCNDGPAGSNEGKSCGLKCQQLSHDNPLSRSC
jgi:galactose oxidase